MPAGIGGYGELVSTARTRTWKWRWFAGFVLCASGAVHGAVVTGLYEASVPVPDQSAAARHVALQQALAAVLVKITGERTAGGVPALAGLVQDPSQFLQQYRYEQSPSNGTNASTPTVTYYDLTRTGAPAIAPTGLVLWAKFDPEVVNHAVWAVHEPVWGQERPATLVWLAIQNGANSSVLSSSDTSPIIQAMTGAATQRGVPLIFPLMDLRDQQDIGFPDIWNDQTSRIQLASQRYQPDAVLVGSMYSTTPGQYAARWQLTVGSNTRSWVTPPGDLASVAAAGIQTAADHYAHWFAIPAGASGVNGVPVTVEGIAGVGAYAKVLAYLRELTPVKTVQVTQVANGTVHFSVDTRGDFANLQRAIVLGELLKPVVTVAAATATGAPSGTTSVSPAPAAVLRFQYVP